MAKNTPDAVGSNNRLTSLSISICALIVSIGINFTRVPIIYAFRLMTCDDYYAKHPIHSPSRLDTASAAHNDLCSIPDVEVATANAVSVLGAMITMNGVVNLITTNWSLKTFGIKAVLVQQLAGPTLRLAVQFLGVRIGGVVGIWTVEAAQLLGVVGGSTGYVLVLTTFMSRVTSPEAQTLGFGHLQGAIMLGTALAHLFGGLTADTLGIPGAFQVACAIMLVAVFYSLIALPSLSPTGASVEGGWEETDDVNRHTGVRGEGIVAKMINPIRALMSTEAISGGPKTYQRPLIAIGVFVGVLATGFIPILLQMYSTNRFGFNSRQNGYLMALTFGVRSLFLSLGFPRIIRAGRAMIARRRHQEKTSEQVNNSDVDSEEAQPNHDLPPADDSAPLLGPEWLPGGPAVETTFDLWFLLVSFFADAGLTAATAFATKPWQLYLSAALLPLASGSAPAAKGVVVSICRPEEQADALGGIATVEMIASVITMVIFGPIFSAFATMGMSNVVFLLNGGLAAIAGVIVLFVRIRH